MNKRRGLGRGLEALIPSADYADELGVSGGRLRATLRLPIEEVRPNPEQPRRNFSPESLEELADSIRIHGIIQPLLVRETADGYELIAGERRLRAAEIAGLKEVPAILHSPLSSAEERLELALVENLQRTDLNPIEEARALRRLRDEFGFTNDAIAERLGKDPTVIAHSLRLLALPEPAIAALINGTLTTGHGKAILGLRSAAEQLAILDRVIKEGWSVRQTEEWVRVHRTDGGTRQRRRVVDPDTQALEDEFRRALGTKVVLTRLKNGGRLTIEFYSDEEFDSLRRKLIES
jgi:ParB family chromosome partitioning protein